MKVLEFIDCNLTVIVISLAGLYIAFKVQEC